LRELASGIDVGFRVGLGRDNDDTGNALDEAEFVVHLTEGNF
jgi:hypothetical protein